MLRVFGETVAKKRTEQPLNTRISTPSNSQNVQSSTKFEHQLELEKLKNEYLQQQVSEQKKLIAHYQDQMNQLNKTLEKANASIHDLTQVRLLEFRSSNTEHSDQQPQLEPLLEKEHATVNTAAKKKKWWKL